MSGASSLSALSARGARSQNWAPLSAGKGGTEMLVLLLAVAAKLPPEMRAYVERRDACEHFAGEEGYDAERQRFLNRQIKQLRCLTLDRDRKRLRLKYRAPAARRELRALYY